MTVCMLYTTFPTREEALQVAKTLLEEKLIACANVVDGATSIFAWQGEVQQQREAIMFAKTTTEKTQAVFARVQALHPYELPSIVTLPIDGGFAPFLQWVEESLSSPT